MTGSRRLVASSRRFDAYERLDLLVHALAQLADPVTLEIIGDTSRSGKLRQLTRAYGIEDRATFSSGSPDPDAEPVFSSAANLAAAPIRPRPGTSPLVLDPSATIAGPRVVRNMAEFVEELTRDDDAPGSTHVVDAALESCRAVIVSNVPAAYRIELFERVAARLAAAGGSLDVVFLAASASGRPWIGDSDVGFRHHFLRSFELPRSERRPLVPLDLERTLARLDPTLVISAGFSPFVSLRVARWASRASVPFGIYSGETRRMPTAQSPWRRPLRRRIAASASFGIVYGFESGEYLFSLAPELPVVHARNTSRVEAGSRHCASSVVRLLTIADLNSDRKGADVLIDAVRLIPDVACDVAIVGSGRDLDALKRRAGSDGRIRFLGALRREEVMAQYRNADVFVFPTRQDVYGLTLVEAMGAGLPTVVSNAPGALGDLAVDGRNCAVVPNYDPEAWAEALRRFAADPDLRAAVGRQAQGTIARRWTLEHSADAMIAGLRLGLLVAQNPRR